MKNEHKMQSEKMLTYPQDRTKHSTDGNYYTVTLILVTKVGYSLRLFVV